MSHQPDHSLTSVSEFEAAAVQGVTEVLLSYPDPRRWNLLYEYTIRIATKSKNRRTKNKVSLVMFISVCTLVLSFTECEFKVELPAAVKV